MTTLLIVSTLAGSWWWKQGDIKGHWHITRASDDAFSGMKTFDVNCIYDSYDDKSYTALTINDFSLNGFGWGGRIDQWTRSSTIYPHCFNMSIRYHRIGDSLYIEELTTPQVPTGAIAVAYRCEEYCCDPQQDVFAGANLTIDLPVRSHSDKEFTEYFDHDSGIEIMIGQNADLEWAAHFYDRPLTDHDLAVLIKQYELKVPERLRGSRLLRLYADRRAPIGMIDDVIAQVREIRPGTMVERVYRDAVFERPVRFYARPVY